MEAPIQIPFGNLRVGAPEWLRQWLGYISVGGLSCLGVSAALFHFARGNDARAFELSRAQQLDSLAGAVRFAHMLPLLVAVRGRVTCPNPAKCELTDTPAVMREMVEQEAYLKENSITGRVTMEYFEVRREQQQREAYLEDTSGAVKVGSLQRAEGLQGVMETRVSFQPVELTQGASLLQALVNKALKSMVKHGVRSTERYLPLNTTVTVIGELVHDTVGPARPHPPGDSHSASSARSQPPHPSQQQQQLTGGADSPSASSAGDARGSMAVAERSASGGAASTSGRDPASAVANAVVSAAVNAATAAGAGMLGQAVAAAGAAAARALPYTLRAPLKGPFVVSHLTLPELQASIEQRARALRAFGWGFGAIGVALLARKALQQLQRAREHRRLKRMMAEAEAARRERQAQRAAAGGGCAADGGGGGAGGGAGQEDEGSRAAGTCVVCLDRDTEVVFSGCGHMCACVRCGAGLQRCPICRVPSRIIRVYRP